MIIKTTEISRYETVSDIVNKYQDAQKAINQAYFILEYAQKQLHTITTYIDVLPRSYGGSLDNAERTIKEIMDGCKKRVWEAILKKTSAPEFMTPKRLKTFQEAMEKPDNLPEITPETIKDFVKNVYDSAPDMLVEFIKSTFDWLQPGKWQQQYKTNQKSQYEIKEKIIKTWCCEQGWSGQGMRLKYHQKENVQAMDNAFHLMDGKGISKYPGNAVTMIEEAGNNNQNQCTTDYFHLKFYKNSNMHIQFRRMDLVNKMNQIAGENLVKPE